MIFPTALSNLMHAEQWPVLFFRMLRESVTLIFERTYGKILNSELVIFRMINDYTWIHYSLSSKLKPVLISNYYKINFLLVFTTQNNSVFTCTLLSDRRKNDVTKTFEELFSGLLTFSILIYLFQIFGYGYLRVPFPVF